MAQCIKCNTAGRTAIAAIVLIALFVLLMPSAAPLSHAADGSDASFLSAPELNICAAPAPAPLRRAPAPLFRHDPPTAEALLLALSLSLVVIGAAYYRVLYDLKQNIISRNFDLAPPAL